MENNLNIEVNKENQKPIYEQFKRMLANYSYKSKEKGQFYSKEDNHENGQVYQFGIIMNGKEVPLFGMDLMHNKLEGKTLVAGQPGYPQFNRVFSLEELIELFNTIVAGKLPEIDMSHNTEVKEDYDGTLTATKPHKR